MKARAIKLGLTLIAGTLLIIPQANAEYYNFGTLDVRPVSRDGTASEWFIEYMNPGEQKQELIQISNFSHETKQLSVYAADTLTNDETRFYVSDIKNPQGDVSEWINLPTNALTLKGGESRILSVNFRLPATAGVGLHTGAVMVREKMDSPTGNFKNVIIEKGVRVYMNVTGTAITEGQINGMSMKTMPGAYASYVTAQNTGTTNYGVTYRTNLRDIFGNIHDSASAEITVKPSSSEIAHIKMTSPPFGFYQTTITDGLMESATGYILFIPFWGALLAAGLSLAYGTLRTPSEKSRRSPNLNWKMIMDQLGKSINGITGSLELQKSFAYLGMLGLATVSTMYAANFDPQFAKSQVIDNAPIQSYELTVKWGNFRNIWLPDHYRKQWHGRLHFPNGTISTMRLLNFEQNDNAQIMGDSTSLRFDTLTGPDNDGIVLKVDSTDGEVPLVRYEDFEKETVYEFPITDFLGSDGIYPDGLFATYFKTEPGEALRLREEIEAASLTELEATAEKEATPTVSQIPELDHLFIEDLPATPDALTDFIFKSDYVNKISEENKTTQIETDSILLQALEATPDILQEIAATPDLNFVFIPTETINFPPQNFSFTQEKATEQDLGTLIFVQNKESAWNTYISTTDFRLLSGDSVIPASALRIIPGEPILLKEDGNKIESGDEDGFRDENDKATLVTVAANGGTKEVFALRPKLRVRIPAGTPAGTYLGSLTISSL